MFNLKQFIMQKKNLFSSAILTLCTLFAFTGCDQIASSLDNPVKPYLSLDKSAVELKIDGTYQIVPKSITTNPVYSYESSNPNVVAVDENGLVTAVDYDGEATITVKVAASEDKIYEAGETELKVTVNTPDIETALSFEAVEDGKIIVKVVGDPKLESPIVAVTNGVKKDITEDTEIEVVEGQKVRFFSENDHTAKNYDNNYVTILAEKKCYVYGNVMSMVTPADAEFKDNKTFTANYALASLFYKPSGYSTKIISHPSKKLLLPATTLTDYCYDNLFNGCSSLDAAPELPAEEMKKSCYFGMFKGCKALTKAPELPAKTLADACYRQMFYGCEALTTAPELPATTLASNCYYSMFRGCKALTKAPALPAGTVLSASYREMFYGCEALTTAPELPATTLASNCYYSMFRGCTSLIEAPDLPATDIQSGFSHCYREMFYGCTSLTKAPTLPATTGLKAGYCYYQMFRGCTSLTKAPDLPAATIPTRGYFEMFNGCTSLNSIKCLATANITGTDHTKDWLKNVAATGTFTKSASATTWAEGASGIPSGWQIASE